MSKCAAIIVAGGSGKRFGSKTPKQFLKLSGLPMFMWSVLAFKRTGLFSRVILAAPKNRLKSLAPLAKKYSFELVPGGKERQDSVKAGLAQLSGGVVSLVAIHDAARPLIKRDVIKRALACAVKRGSAVVSVPARDTVKLASDGNIVKTIPRNGIWLAQTPQIFKRSVIEKAYLKLGRTVVTDDAQAAELMGLKVRVVMGDYGNIKITDKEDFNAAQNILKNTKRRQC